MKTSSVRTLAAIMLAISLTAQYSVNRRREQGRELALMAAQEVFGKQSQAVGEPSFEKARQQLEWGDTNAALETIQQTVEQMAHESDEVPDLEPKEEQGKWGFVNSQGDWIIPATFEQVYSFSSSGLAPVKQNGSWGLIDEQGESVMLGKFDSPSELVPAVANDRWGYRNTNREWVIPPVFSVAADFADNGLAAVVLSDAPDYKSVGFINPKGELVIPAQFNSALNFEENGHGGLAAVEYKADSSDVGKWGFINAKGDWVTPAQFEDLKATRYDLMVFNEFGLAIVKLKDKWGVINTKGEWVAPASFEDISYFQKNQKAMVKRDGKYGFIDISGAIVIPVKYDKAKPFADNGLAAVYIGDIGSNTREESGKWGYINTSGEWVIPAKFDMAYSFESSGLAVVELNEKLFYIDEKGICEQECPDSEMP